MVHEAMVLEYSGRHLALIELAAALKLAALYVADRLHLSPLGPGSTDAGVAAACDRRRRLVSQACRRLASLLGAVRNSIAKMRVFRVPEFLGAALMLGLLGALLRFVSAELLDERHLDFDVAHLLAGGLVLVSFALLYQDRLYALLNVYALHALVLALSVAWQAFIQDAPHLYITAAIALAFKAIVIPVALRRIIVRLGIHREIENGGRRRPDHAGRHGARRAVDGGHAAGHQRRRSAEREDLAFALSVVLLGLLLMVTRRNAVGQVVGFMSLENGLVLAATGAKGMPLVVEISVAFSILIAFIVIGIFLFRIRERFDTVDLQALDRFRGERP